MDDEHINAVNQLKSLLEPFTEEYCHHHNVDLARITFPYSTIPYDVDKEIWKPLDSPSFIKGKYLVSTWGRVFDSKNNFYLISKLCDKGYVRVSIERSKDTQCKSFSVATRIHRLVAMTFITKIEGKDTVNHINLNKTNNTISNLEWMTNTENILHAVKNGARIDWGGFKYFTKDAVDDIRLRHNNGETIISLAKIYNRQFRCISDIVNGKTYNDDFWEVMGFNEQTSKYRLEQLKNIK